MCHEAKHTLASTLEGGSGATIMCVPEEVNDWQGTYWSSWLSEAKKQGLVSGGQFRLKLKYYDIPKRDLEKRDNPVLSSANNGTNIQGRCQTLLIISQSRSFRPKLSATFRMVQMLSSYH